MFLLILVLACAGSWALDPEAIPEHQVTNIPVESEGVLSVFYDRSGLISIQTNDSTTTKGSDAITNGVTLSEPDGHTSTSTGVTMPTTEISSTVGFPTTSEEYKPTILSTTTPSVSLSSTTTTHKPEVTRSTTSGDTTNKKKPAITSPTTPSISGHNASISYTSGNTKGVHGLTNVSSSLSNISSGTDVSDNATGIDVETHTSDFYLPANALGNHGPENSSGFSNHTMISSAIISISNSSVHDKANSSRDLNSTNTSNYTRISQNSEPALISSNNMQSNLTGMNIPANIKEENGTIIISSVYSHTNIPSVNNPINITDVFSPVNISDVFFPINISNIYSPINISGIYSPVNIVNVYSPVTISNVRSPVRISNVFSLITIYDVYSPVNITNVHSSVNASNVYSLISIDDYKRKVNISEKFNAINSSKPQNSDNDTDIYTYHNITNVYDIENVIDTLNISDILDIFGLEIPDLYGPTNISHRRNFTNIDSGDLFDIVHPDLYSTTEPYSYSTSDWAYAYYTGITTPNSTNVTSPESVTGIPKANDTSKILSTSLPTQISVTTSTRSFTNTTHGASNSFDIDSFYYFDYPDNASKSNDTGVTTTEGSSSTYYTTELATANSTKEPINITEPYSPLNFTGEGGLVNISISLNPDNITIENRVNNSDSQDLDNGTQEERGPTCPGGDILKHIFLTYRLSPPHDTRTPRVYVIPLPVQVPVPVQVYTPSYYIPLDPYNAFFRGNSFNDYFPSYYGSSQPQGISSNIIGWDPTSSYHTTYGSAPPLLSQMGHVDPLGYQGGHLDSYKYQYNTLNSPFESSMYPSGDLVDKRFSPIGPPEDIAFEPEPYFLMDITGGDLPSLTDQVPQGPISYQTDYKNKDSMTHSSEYNPQGFPTPYNLNYNSDDSGPVSYSTDYNPQGSKSYQELDSFYKGLQSEDLKLFSDYMVPQDTKSYFDYSSGLDKDFYKTSTHRGDKWNLLELNAPKQRTLDWTRHLENKQLSRWSGRSHYRNSDVEPPMMSKFDSRPRVVNMQALMTKMRKTHPKKVRR